MKRRLDGGWGWVVVGASFLAYLLADGCLYSFGVLYPSLVTFFQQGKGRTSVVGALLFGMPRLVCPLVCALTLHFGCRTVAVLGGFLTGLGFACSSMATSVDFLSVGIGIVASIGLQMTYTTAIVIVTFYFERRRGLASGLSAMGSGLGAFCFPPLMEFLVNSFAWRGAVLLLGGIAFHIILAGALFRPPTGLIAGSNEGDDLPSTEEEQIDNSNGFYFKSPQGQDSLISKPYEQDQIFRSVRALHLTHECERHRTHQSDLELYRTLSVVDIGPSSNMLASYHSLMSLTRPNALQDTEVANSSSNINPTTTKQIQVLQDSRLCYSNYEFPKTKGVLADGDDADSCDVSVTTDSEVSREMGLARSARRVWREIRTLLGSMVDRALLSKPSFLVFCVSSFLLYLWISAPLVFLVDKAGQLGIGQEDAALLLSVIGISRTVGQGLVGFLGDQPWVDVLVLYGACVTLTGAATAVLPVLVTYPGLVGFAAVFGMAMSVTYSLPMMCAVHIVGLNKATSAFGLIQLVQGVAALLGTPAVGWVSEVTGSYDTSFYIAGAWMTLSGVMLVSLKVYQRFSRKVETPQ